MGMSAGTTTKCEKRLDERAKNVREFIEKKLRKEEGYIIQVHPITNFFVGYYNPRKSEGKNLFLSNECEGVIPNSPHVSDKGIPIPYEEINTIWVRGTFYDTYDLVYHFNKEGNGREGGVIGRAPIPQSKGDKIN